MVMVQSKSCSNFHFFVQCCFILAIHFQLRFPFRFRFWADCSCKQIEKAVAQKTKSPQGPVTRYSHFKLKVRKQRKCLCFLKLC